jgi:hypothetical protein
MLPILPEMAGDGNITTLATLRFVQPVEVKERIILMPFA